MFHKSWKNLHKPWKGRVNAVAHNLNRATRAEQGLHRIGAVAAPGGGVKARLRAAQELTGLPYSRARELWYGRARRVEDDELEVIEAAVPPDTVESTVAYVRSIRNRVAALLDELVAVQARCEAELAARGDGRGNAPVRPLRPGVTVSAEEHALRTAEALRLFEHSTVAGERSIALYEQACAIAPWVQDIEAAGPGRPRLVARDGVRR